MVSKFACKIENELRMIDSRIFSRDSTKLDRSFLNSWRRQNWEMIWYEEVLQSNRHNPKAGSGAFKKIISVSSHNKVTYLIFFWHYSPLITSFLKNKNWSNLTYLNMSKVRRNFSTNSFMYVYMTSICMRYQHFIWKKSQKFLVLSY